MNYVYRINYYTLSPTINETIFVVASEASVALNKFFEWAESGTDSYIKKYFTSLELTGRVL